jgi:hypothetical protein
MSINITELIMLQQRINECNEEILRISNIRDITKKELNDRCSHPTIVTQNHYIGDGYGCLPRSWITETCTICGNIVREYDDTNHRRRPC